MEKKTQARNMPSVLHVCSAIAAIQLKKNGLQTTEVKVIHTKSAPRAKSGEDCIVGEDAMPRAKELVSVRDRMGTISSRVARQRKRLRDVMEECEPGAAHVAQFGTRGAHPILLDDKETTVKIEPRKAKKVVEQEEEDQEAMRSGASLACGGPLKSQKEFHARFSSYLVAAHNEGLPASATSGAPLAWDEEWPDGFSPDREALNHFLVDAVEKFCKERGAIPKRRKPNAGTGQGAFTLKYT